MIRTLIAAALALVCAAPVSAAPVSAAPAVSATCASLPAILASAKGGETITLKNQTCEQITIKKTVLPKSQVTINAGGSTVRGLLIYGQNIRWRGGRIVAPKGVDGKATDVYGLLIRNTRNVRVDGVTFGLSRKAVVTDTADNVTISDNRFDGYGEDGIISSATTRLTIERNRFTNVVGNPTTCTLGDGSVVRALSAAQCKQRFGIWIDGYHPDAIQLRNGVKRAIIRFNFVDGNTQGITQMDMTSDAPIDDILIERNEVRATIHHISLGGTGCTNCRIVRNVVRRWSPTSYKAVIRNGPARRCGNDVQDEKSDGIC